MNYCKSPLPANARLAGITPFFTDRTIPKAMRLRHRAPRGKYGYLEVRQGALRFVWEDTGIALDAVPGHPVLIFPERPHHIEITGPVEFRVRFFQVTEALENEAVPIGAVEDPRPGETFLNH